MTVRNKDNVSISEVRAALEDAIRFSLEPLLGLVRSEGVTKNARLLSLYATNQVFQLRLDKEEALGRAQALQESLRAYMQQRNPQVVGGSGSPEGSRPAPGDMPAALTLGESFLDRLVQMSGDSLKNEMEYRQRLTDELLLENKRVATFNKELVYYQDLANSLTGVGSRPAGSPELIKLIRDRSVQAFEAIVKATNQLGDLYKELSSRNLNPAARLFAITGPYTERAQRAISSRAIAMAFALVLMVTLVVASVVCAAYEAFRQQPRRVKDAVPAP